MATQSNSKFRSRALEMEPIQEENEVPETPKATTDKKPSYSFKERAEQLEGDRHEGIAHRYFREHARSVARAAETGLGAPRAFGEFLESIVPEKALKAGAKAIGLEKGAENLLETTKKFAPHKLFPAQKQLRELTKDWFGQFTEPHSEGEKVKDELVETTLPFFLPGTGPLGGARNIAARIASPINGVLGKQIVKYFGGSENAQELTKLGLMFGTSLAGGVGALTHARNLLRNSETLVPQGARMDATPMERILDRITNAPWFRTGRTRAKGPAMDEVQRIRNAIQNGTMDVHDALQIRRDINEASVNLGGFEFPNAGTREQAVAHLNEVREALLEGINNYGATQNPAFHEANQLANQAYAVTRRSSALANFIHIHYSKPIVSTGAKILLGAAITAGAKLAPAAATVGIPLLVVQQAMKLLNRVNASPALRRYYTGVLRNAARGNAKEMTKNVERLDKTFEKEEKKSKFYKKKT